MGATADGNRGRETGRDYTSVSTKVSITAGPRDASKKMNTTSCQKLI